MWLQERVSEYRYRRMMPGTTQEQYLDLPVDEVAWMLTIDSVYTAAEAKRQQPKGR